MQKHPHPSPLGEEGWGEGVRFQVPQKSPGSSLIPGFFTSVENYSASTWPTVGSLNKRVNASLNTSLTSFVLVSWFGAMPKR